MSQESTTIQDVGEYINQVFQPTKEEKRNECELCNMTKKTKWYYEDDNWIVCECKTCHRPIAIYKLHTMFIPLEQLGFILNKVNFYFGRNVTVRMKQRRIKNHFHFHVYKEK